MANFIHDQRGSNNIHVYERKNLGPRLVYRRGTAKNISVGDTFQDFNVTYTVEKVLSLTDAPKGGGVYPNPEDRINCLYEAELSF